MYPPGSPAGSVSRAESMRRRVAAEQLGATLEQLALLDRLALFVVAAPRHWLARTIEPELARAISRGTLRAAILDRACYWRREVG